MTRPNRCAIVRLFGCPWGQPVVFIIKRRELHDRITNRRPVQVVEHLHRNAPNSPAAWSTPHCTGLWCSTLLVRAGFGHEGDIMAVLADVLTIQEVSRYWGRNENTVRYHLNRGNLRWRYTATGRVLIERTSVEALWGQPVNKPDENV